MLSAGTRLGPLEIMSWPAPGHDDDESADCGGFLLVERAAQREVHVVLNGFEEVLRRVPRRASPSGVIMMRLTLPP